VINNQRHTVIVFGSSRPREGSREYNVAYEVGRLVAESGYTLCNGGYGGTMEASARGAKDAGGSTVGVVAEFFSVEPNPYIDHRVVVTSPADRLLKLLELGDAYVILRGGTGTLVELATAWEYANKRVIKAKPIIVVGNFWSKVIDALKKELVRERRRSAAHYVTVVRSARQCIELLGKKLPARSS